MAECQLDKRVGMKSFCEVKTNLMEVRSKSLFCCQPRWQQVMFGSIDFHTRARKRAESMQLGPIRLRGQTSKW